MSIFAILEGIISSVPEAIQLYHRIAPLLSERADIHENQIAAVNEAVPAAHAALVAGREAIQAVIQSAGDQPAVEKLIEAYGPNYTPPPPPPMTGLAA